LWNEWHGLAEFHHSRNGSCYPGGVLALETKYKRAWRNTEAESRLFSRHNFVISAIKKIMVDQNRNEDDVLNEYQNLFVSKKMNSISGMERYLKSLN